MWGFVRVTAKNLGENNSLDWGLVLCSRQKWRFSVLIDFYDFWDTTDEWVTISSKSWCRNPQNTFHWGYFNCVCEIEPVSLWRNYLRIVKSWWSNVILIVSLTFITALFWRISWVSHAHDYACYCGRKVYNELSRRWWQQWSRMIKIAYLGSLITCDETRFKISVQYRSLTKSWTRSNDIERWWSWRKTTSLVLRLPASVWRISSWVGPGTGMKEKHKNLTSLAKR